MQKVMKNSCYEDTCDKNTIGETLVTSYCGYSLMAYPL